MRQVILSHMDHITTLTVAFVGLITGAVIPYLYSLFKNKKAQLDEETKKILDRHEQKLEQIHKEQKKLSSVHGLNPDDISCKEDINQLLEQLRQTTGATRTTVWAFHNGSYFSSGNPQRRLTTVFEAMPIGRSYKSEYDLIKGELLNGFSGILKELLIGASVDVGGTMVNYGRTAYAPCENCQFDHKCILHPTQRPKYCFLKCEIDNIPVGTKFYRVMKELGTRIFWGHIIVDDTGAPIGVLTLQYNDDSDEAHNMVNLHPKPICEKTQQIKNSLRNLQDLT